MAGLFGRRQKPERPVNPFVEAAAAQPPATSPGPKESAPESGGETWAAAAERARRRAQAEEIANRRPGRPVLDDAMKRSSRFTVSVNQAERERLQQAADDGGVTLSRWVREAALRERDRHESEGPRMGLIGEVNQLRAEMRRSGNNLNQIARALNQEARGGPSVDRDRIAAVLAELRAGQLEQRAMLRALTGEV